MKCREAELNCRHKDFQSSALPTELSGRFKSYIHRASMHCICLRRHCTQGNILLPVFCCARSQKTRLSYLAFIKQRIKPTCCVLVKAFFLQTPAVFQHSRQIKIAPFLALKNHAIFCRLNLICIH